MKTERAVPTSALAIALPVAIAFLLTDNPVPQLAIADILPKLNQITRDLGLTAYAQPFTELSKLNVLLMTIALMVGTAGLPHVIVRFYTVRSVRAARWSTSGPAAAIGFR